LAQRLRNTGKAQSLKVDEITDPFRATAAAEQSGENFKTNHSLMAIMVSGRGGSAIISGKCVRVGQSVDGYKLESIADGIATLSAIAIPRMSRGAAGAADSALVGDLKTLRSAIELYANEHGGLYPGLKADGTTDYTVVVNELTKYSDDQGVTSATKTATAIY